MTDSRANVEIEDVLSSIRRLVSQDVPPVARTMPASGHLRAAVAPVPPVAPPAPAVTEETLRGLNLRPTLAPAPEAPADDHADEAVAPSDFLVLTPALRVSDSEADMAAGAEDDEEAWEVEDLSGPEAQAEADEWQVEEIAPAMAEAPQPDVMQAAEAEDMAEGSAGAEAAEAPFWEDAVSDEALDLELPQGGSVTAWPHAPARHRGEDAAEAEQDAAEAEMPAADTEEGLTLDYADDLGEELARLEHKIAEMEAAVALDSGAYDAAEDNAELGGSGDQADAEEDATEAGLAVDLTEWEADAAADTPALAGDVAEADLEEPLMDPWGAPGESWDDLAALDGATEAELATAGAEAVAADADADQPMAEVALDDHGPAEQGEASARQPDGGEGEPPAETDPEQALWADSGALDWSDEDVDATPAAAYEAGPRRLHLADAQEAPHHPRILRSTYEQLRSEEVPFEEEAEQGLFDEGVEGLMDEEALRVLVSEMIRQELQGTLGERITRNVRKLVRREIQRALSSQDFD